MATNATPRRRSTDFAPATTPLDTGDVKNRIHHCRGAVSLAIGGILDGDVNSIDAAVGSLSLVERELQQLNVAIDVAEMREPRRGTNEA